MDTSRQDPWDIEAQALQLLVRLDRERSPEAAAEVEAWKARSPRHHVAYAKQEIAWKRSDALKRLRPLEFNREADPDLLAPRRGVFRLFGVTRAFSRSRSTTRMVFSALAVGVVILLAMLLVVLPRGDLHFVTQVGEQRHVVLADGTELTVNTNSEVRVRFTAEKRRLFLERGEILLDVARDGSRPLEVIAGDVTSRAVGTKFSVRVHEGDERVETLVTEGRVLVLRQPHVLGIPLGRPAVTRTLSAGEKVTVVDGKPVVSRVTAKQVERRLMWSTGRIVLDGERLSEVVSEINRYNPKRQLVILDPEVAETTLGGAFDTADADAYAQGLVRFFGDKRLSAVPPGSAQ